MQSPMSNVELSKEQINLCGYYNTADNFVLRQTKGERRKAKGSEMNFNVPFRVQTLVCRAREARRKHAEA